MAATSRLMVAISAEPLKVRGNGMSRSPSQPHAHCHEPPGEVQPLTMAPTTLR